jgi:hypothetical protein
MHILTRFAARLGVAGFLTVPAMAQTARPVPSPTVAMGMTMPEYQGWGCLVGGTSGATGVFVYSDAITFAATGALNPVLLIPVMATGFAVGCGVGATVSPAFLWIGRVIGGD